MVECSANISNASIPMCQITILEAFAGVEDPRRRAGQRHTLSICLALFTLVIAAGNRGFLAIGDWITSYRSSVGRAIKTNIK